MAYLEEIKAIWDMVKTSFIEVDGLSQSVVDLWFRDLELIEFEDRHVKFKTNSEFKYTIISEHYIKKVNDKFTKLLGFDVTCEVILDESDVNINEPREYVVGYSARLEQEEQKQREELRAAEEAIEEAEAKGEEPPSDAEKIVFLQNYNFEYTFDNFIVGNSNKFAHAACMAVAKRSPATYNPLFIYGPSGLGKTHLMHAVVNELKKRDESMRVVYIKGEEFTNQMIESLSKHEMDKFRQKYRNCDILLIDDIQFIAGKTSTQEEFFHTFNELYEHRKQIILSSDRPPKDIHTLEDRLKTRFEWGLLADIEPPDLELRVAIIKKKAEQISVERSDDVLNFLAENLRSNIRQIEGAVKKLSALSFLTGKEISVETANGCIAELLGGAEPINVTVDKIFSTVYKRYGISKEDIVGTKRNKEIANARHIMCYLIREVTEMSFPNIGKLMNRDHATILSSYEKIKKKLFSDPIFAIEMHEIKRELDEIIY